MSASPIVGLAALCSLAAPTAGAQPPVAVKRLAVLQLQGSVASGPLSESQLERLRVLTEAARAGALEGSRGRQVEVMSSEQIELFLKNNPPCHAGDQCEIELARTLQADFVLTGEAKSTPDGSHLVLKVHETDNGKLLSTKVWETAEIVTPEMVQDGAQDVVSQALLQAGVNGADFPSALEDRKRLVRPSLPNLSAPPNIDMEAEAQLEAAVTAHQDPKTPSADIERAWCALARKSNPNYYRDAASELCRQWKEYAARRAAIEPELERDYRKLVAFVRLSRPPLDDKLRQMDRFLRQYGDLAQDPRVTEVQKMRLESRRSGSVSVSTRSTASAREALAGPSSQLPVHILRGLSAFSWVVGGALLLAAFGGAAASAATFAAMALVYGVDKYRAGAAFTFYGGLVVVAVAPAAAVLAFLLGAISLAASMRTP